MINHTQKTIFYNQKFNCPAECETFVKKNDEKIMKKYLKKKEQENVDKKVNAAKMIMN